MLRVCLLVICSMFSFTSQGSVSDSGGKIHKWSSNPWYLENTPEVSYCIHLSEDFGGSILFYKLAIRSALNDWKSMFEQAKEDEGDSRYLSPYKSIRVGTQKFVERCDNDTDIRFMLGGLTEEQREHFNSPRDFVGAAIRTEYDLKNLRSKGFIYIAPLSGPLKPKIEGLLDQKWNSDALAPTFLILLHHELGHVFGLNHGSGFFMQQDVPEQAIGYLADSDKAIRAKQKTRIGPSLFTLLMGSNNMDTFGCKGDPIFTRKFLKKLHPTHPCGRIAVDGNEIRFYTAETLPFPREKNWQLRAKSIEGAYNATIDNLVRVFLPDEQSVFANTFEGERRFHFEAEWVVAFAKQNGVLEYEESGEKAPYLFYFKQEPLTARSFFTQVDSLQLENVLCLDLCFNFGREKEKLDERR